jgi:hypothetical protein
MMGPLLRIVSIVVFACFVGLKVNAQQPADCGTPGCLTCGAAFAAAPVAGTLGTVVNFIGSGVNPCGPSYTVTIPAGSVGSHARVNVRGGFNYTFSLCATVPDFNTKMYITTSTALLVACDDDGCGTPGGLSSLTFAPNLAVGTTNTYRVYVFDADCTPGTPTALSSAVTLTVTCNGVAPPNNTICTASPLAVGTSCTFQNGSTLGATGTTVAEASPAITLLPVTDCASGGTGYIANTGDVWFTAVVPASGTLGINTLEQSNCAGSFGLYRRTGGACPAAGVMTYVGGSCSQVGFTGPTSDPGNIFTGLIPGETLYIRYWERGGIVTENGSFQICAFDPQRPPNDNPCGAITLPASTTCNPVTYSNEYAAALGAGNTFAPADVTCGNTTTSGFRDVWFRVQVTAQMVSDGLTVTTFAGTLDDVAMSFYRFAPSCPAGGVLTNINTVAPGPACNSAISGSNLMAQVNTRSPDITPALVAGDIGSFIYVRVWSETPYYGTFSICARENITPLNDQPCGAITLPVNYGCSLTPANNAGANNTLSNVYGTGSIGNVPGGCAPNNNPAVADVWYQFTMPNPLPTAPILVNTEAGLLDNGGVAAYVQNPLPLPGPYSCALGNLRLSHIGCSSDTLPDSPFTATMGGLSINTTGRTPGETIWIRVWRQGGIDGNFSICVERTDVPVGDCVYTVNLFDTGADGWQGSDVTICNNGVCNTYTNLDGTPVTLQFGVISGTPFVVTYNANGAGQQAQNRFTVVQTSFTPNTSVFNSGNGMSNGSSYTTAAADCAPPPSPPTDCLGAVPMCNNVTESPTNNSGIPDLGNGNRGCLGGENGGSWYSLNVAQDGQMAFNINYTSIFFLFGFIPIAVADYDFAIWGPYGPYAPVVGAASDTASLTPICPPSTAPIRCDASLADILTGSTGLQINPALAVSQGAFGNQFVRHLNVTTGQVYLLYVTPNFGNSPYTITWNNTPTVPNPDPLPDFTEGDDMLVCGPLPVEMLYFDAKPSEQQVHVSWATASEMHSDFFEVQRSADGISFLPIGRVQAAGYSQGAIQYGFIDDAPLPGLSYYRLRQVDTDATWAFSRAVPVRFQSNVNSTGLDLYPNPANESVTLGFDLSNESGVVWRIMDTSGRLVITGNTAGEKGRNRLNVPLTALDPGAYIMDLRDGAGHSLGTARFVKQ